MQEDLAADCQNLKKFLKSYEAGDLKPYIKSAPLPPPSDDAVIEVVGSTFSDIVLDSTKDVFIGKAGIYNSILLLNLNFRNYKIFGLETIIFFPNPIKWKAVFTPIFRRGPLKHGFCSSEKEKNDTHGFQKENFCTIFDIF